MLELENLFFIFCLFPQYKPKGAVELCWYKYKFQEDQDMRLKVGYELYNQVI